MLRGVDFTKGSDHKERLREKLFGKVQTAQFPDELGFDELTNVRAAVKSFEGIKKT